MTLPLWRKALGFEDPERPVGIDTLVALARLPKRARAWMAAIEFDAPSGWLLLGGGGRSWSECAFRYAGTGDNDDELGRVGRVLQSTPSIVI